MDEPGIERVAAQERVADGAGLLENLFEHEVLVALLFDLDRIPSYPLRLPLLLASILVDDGDLAALQYRDIAIVEKHDRTGMAQKAGTSEAMKDSSSPMPSTSGGP